MINDKCHLFFFPPSFDFIKRYEPSPMAEAHIQRSTLLIGQSNKSNKTLSPNWLYRPKPTYSNQHRPILGTCASRRLKRATLDKDD